MPPGPARRRGPAPRGRNRSPRKSVRARTRRAPRRQRASRRRASRRWLSSRPPRIYGDGSGLQIVGQGEGKVRAGEVIALHEIDAELAQRRTLLFGLDALGDETGVELA